MQNHRKLNPPDNKKWSPNGLTKVAYTENNIVETINSFSNLLLLYVEHKWFNAGITKNNPKYAVKNQYC